MAKQSSNRPDDLVNSIFDEGDGKSIYALSPPLIKKAIDTLTFEHVNKRERTLADNAKAQHDDSLATLRMNFWAEYMRCSENGQMMSLRRIVMGAMHNVYFQETILTNPSKVAYMVTPPKSLMQMNELILRRGLKQMRAMMDIDPVDSITTEKFDSDGNIIFRKTETKVNTPLLKEKRETVLMLADRVSGTVVQKLAIGNVGRQGALPPKKAEALDEMADIDKELKKLEPKKVKADDVLDAQYTDKEEANGT
jgi:hypothetical protein